MNEFRQDPITRQWVIIAAGRESRPNQFHVPRDQRPAEEVTSAGSADCPFCIHQMDTPPIITQYGDSGSGAWQVCVVPNRFPVLNWNPEGIRAPQSRSLFANAAAEGCHEVVIESATHCEKPSALTDDQVFYMLQAYRDRTVAMREIPGVRYVLPMKNSGSDAGASLRHCHSQLFGLPLVPKRVEQELEGASEYWSQQGRCVFCDLLQQEVALGSRIVFETPEFVAWCPHASRFNYEIWLAPRQHVSRFEISDDDLLRKLGKAMVRLFGKLAQIPRIQAFNYLFHSQPFDTDPQDHYHWHIEFLPRIAKQAGFEWGTGIHINTVDPDQAASELRIA